MKNFQHSELILNSDGSVYHLHLLPHQIADIIVTVGDPERVPLVSQYFDILEHHVQKREFITHTGTIGQKRISVISTGIGTDNIDIVLNELHLLANYDFENKQFREVQKKLTIIRIGTSGCIQPDIDVDTFLLSEYAIGLDNLLHFYSYRNTSAEDTLLQQFKLHAYFYHTIHPYVAGASAQLSALFNDSFLRGITLTAPGFYGPQGRKINAPITMEKFYADIMTFSFNNWRITNIEMETAGLYGLSNLLGHACISCNALLANRSNGKFSAQPETTIKKLIRKIIDEVLPRL